MEIPDDMTTTFTGDLSVNYTFGTNTTTMDIVSAGGVRVEMDESKKFVVTGIKMNLTNVNEVSVVFTTGTKSFNMKVGITLYDFPRISVTCKVWI